MRSIDSESDGIPYSDSESEENSITKIVYQNQDNCNRIFQGKLLGRTLLNFC